MQPRDYQQEGIDKIYEHLYVKGYGGTIAHLATGLGKTYMIACFIKQHIDLNTQRVIFSVHRQDLIIQTYYDFLEAFPEWRESSYTIYGRRGIGIVMGNINQPDARIVIGTPQTLSSVEGTSNRLEEILSYGAIDLLVIDEAHYGASQSYLNLARHIQETSGGNSKRVGLTATPMRSDGITLRHPLGTGLGNLFDTICISRNILWGIANGYLAPIRLPLLVTTNIDAPTGKGSLEERAKLIDVGNWAELYVKGYVDHGEGRLGVHFLPSVQHSKTIQQAFLEAGIPAIHVDGDGLVLADGTELHGKEAYDRRRQTYRECAENHYQLCNYAVLDHGFNLPRIDLIGLGQPTDSQVRITQQIGRGTRLHKDKKDLLILDYILKDIPPMLQGSLSGFTWDEKTGEMVIDEEVELEDELPTNLLDVKEEGELVNATGIVVRTGDLFRKHKEAWYYAEGDCSLSLSTEDILYIHSPHYSLADRIMDGILAGRDWLLTHDDKASQEFYDNLVETYKIQQNFTLWHLHKDSQGWFVSLGKCIAAAPSPELVFDYALPIISRFEVSVLVNKQQPWRGKRIPPTESQLAFLRSMQYNDIPTNKGEASKAISHVISQRNVNRIVNQLVVNCRQYGIL